MDLNSHGQNCDHPYTSYRCRITGRTVCHQCDLFGENWAHTPAASEGLAKVRRTIEDRLRKDSDFLIRVCHMITPDIIDLPDTQFRRDGWIVVKPQHTQLLPEDVVFLKSKGWRCFKSSDGDARNLSWYDCYPPLS